MARAFICIQVLFNWAARLSAVEMGRALACVPPFAILGAESRRGETFRALAVGGAEMGRAFTCMRDTTMYKINFAGLKGGTLRR